MAAPVCEHAEGRGTSRCERVTSRYSGGTRKGRVCEQPGLPVRGLRVTGNWLWRHQIQKDGEGAKIFVPVPNRASWWYGGRQRRPLEMLPLECGRRARPGVAGEGTRAPEGSVQWPRPCSACSHGEAPQRRECPRETGCGEERQAQGAPLPHGSPRAPEPPPSLGRAVWCPLAVPECPAC